MFFDADIKIDVETDRIKHPVKGEGEIIEISQSGHITIRYNNWPYEDGKIDIMHRMLLETAIIYNNLEVIKNES